MFEIKLSNDESVLGQLALCLHEGEQSFNDVYNWIIDVATGKKDLRTPDALDVLANFGEASSIFHFLKQKSLKEREKIMKARPDLSWDEFIKRIATLQGAIDGLDETDTDLLESTINDQLISSANIWKQIVESYKPEDIDHPEEPEASSSDLIFQRDQLEYTAIGILLIQAQHPYFRTVKVKEFQQKIHAMDKQFKELLEDKRELQFWADPVFWWRHKAE